MDNFYKIFNTKSGLVSALIVFTVLEKLFAMLFKYTVFIYFCATIY
jgi:hypothetical protein